MTIEIRAHPLPELTGGLGLTQSVYGERGNLELVAPGAAGGVWVFWFNADTVDRRQGPPPGAWSGGLHFAESRPVRCASISQVPFGPDYLEVTLLTDRGAERQYWTPEDGFVDAGIVLPGARTISAVVPSDEGTLHIAAVDRRGHATRLTATTGDYPRLRWLAQAGPVADEVVVYDAAADAPASRHGPRVYTATGRLPGDWSAVRNVAGSARHLVGLDTSGRITIARLGADGWQTQQPWPGTRVDDVAAARTSLGLGRIDLVARTGTALRHGWLDLRGNPSRALGPVLSRVWADPGAAVHRG